MNEIQATFVLILLFALRCLLPLVITLAIGYVMNGLVTRWQAEEQAHPIPVPVLATAGARCWDVKHCPPEQRNRCPAYLRSGVPCWQARQEAEGKLPALCVDCPLYRGVGFVAA